MEIGILREVKIGEKRVALTPQGCIPLLDAGHQLYIEKQAGERAGFPDAEYQQLGVNLCQTAQDVYARSKLLVKVKEPQEQELLRFRSDHLLFCYLHLGGNRELCENLKKIGLTAYGFETISFKGATPCLAPMSAIAGRVAVQIGTRLLHSQLGGKGALLGGTSTAPEGKVIVLGAGIAGFEAAALALHMGALVQLIDINPQALARAKEKLPGIQTFLSRPDLIESLIPSADLLVGAVYQRGKRATKVVSLKQVALMSPGSVIVDIAIDQGGCIEGSRPCTHMEPGYVEGEVMFSAVTNLPAAVPHSASIALSKSIGPYLLALAEGQLNHPGLESGKNLEGGKLFIEL